MPDWPAGYSDRVWVYGGGGRCPSCGAALGDDLQTRQGRELAAHRVRDAVAKVVVLLGARVFEGKHHESFRAPLLRGSFVSPPREDDSRRDNKDGGADGNRTRVLLFAPANGVVVMELQTSRIPPANGERIS